MADTIGLAPNKPATPHRATAASRAVRSHTNDKAIIRIHPTEIDALRWTNRKNSGLLAVFVPAGTPLADAIKLSEL